MAERSARLHHLDNLKVALIVLVVLHHAAQPYGPPDWWYVPGGRRSSLLESFTVVNGAFFMALLFAISAYLIPATYDRKGGRAFVTGRLKRLRIPLFAGTLTVIPFLMYVYYRVGAVLALGYYLGRDQLAPYFAGGGANARQLLWSSYESALCVSLSVGLAVLFREKLNRTSSLLRLLAADSFAVYIVHVPVVVLLQLAIRQADIAPLSAFAIVGSAAVVASFAIGHQLRRLPGVRSVL